MSDSQRLKSKMKKADPENFSIHDFLAECKSADAADSRFDEENHQEVYEFATSKGNLTPLYEKVTDLLLNRGWQKKKDSGRFHLILGSQYGKNIPFKRFAQLFKWDYGITPHCNYYRGYDCLTKKSNMVQTIRKYELENREEEGFEFVPKSFLFYPSKPDEDQVDAFRIAFESNSKRGERNVWLVEPVADDGEAVDTTPVLSNDYDEILDMVHNSPGNAYSYAVQQYVADPMLLNDGAKFELTYYVLLDHKYGIHMYNDAQVNACESEFDLKQLNRADKHFPTSPGMNFEQFRKWVSSEREGANDSMREQCENAIRQVFQAGKKSLRTVEHADFTCFQLFKFHFTPDANLKMWLTGIESSPEVAADAVDSIAEEIVELAIDPVFPTKNASKSISRHRFGLIQRGVEAPAPAARPLQARSSKK